MKRSHDKKIKLKKKNLVTMSNLFSLLTSDEIAKAMTQQAAKE